MTDFLNSLKADLLDRRTLPLLVALGVALVGAFAYAVLSGGSTPATQVSPPPTVARVTGIAVTPAPANPTEAVAETTNGYSVQHGGGLHNPFAPLPMPKAKAAASTTSTSSSSSSSASAKSESGTTTPSGGSTTPTTPSKPSAPKSHTVYHVDILFGAVPAGSLLASPQLTPQLTAYQNLKSLTPLPSAKKLLARFLGVTSGGKSAVFALGETIIHGNATCIPSTAQCQAIALKAGQDEQLEYLAANGEVAAYELRIVSIAPSTASSASVKNAWANNSKTARRLIGKAGLEVVPGLHFSQSAGVLVFAPRRPSSRHAHPAMRVARPRG